MEASNKSNSTDLNRQAFEIISKLLVCLMMTCVGVSINQIGMQLISGWKGRLLPMFCFLIAVERMIMHKRIKHLVILGKTWFLFQVTLWVVILLSIKFALLIAFPPESWLIEFQLWRLNFIGNFFDIPYIYTLLFVIIIWMLSGYFTGLLTEMNLDEALIRYETALMAPTDEPPVRERLLGAVFTIGFILVMITAVLRINLRLLIEEGLKASELILPLPYLAAGAWNVLLYFLLGLSLMSLSQFARMNARWSFQKIKVTTRLASRWAGYSFGFILIVAILTSLLPTTYSSGLLSSITQVFTVIFGFVIYIVSILFSVLIFLIGLLAKFLGLGTIDQGSLPTPAFIHPEIPIQATAAGTEPWWDLVKSLIFWAIFVSLVGFSISTFVGLHSDFFRNLSKVQIISWLVNAWRSLKILLRGLNTQISTMIDSGLGQLRSRQREIKTKRGRNLLHYRRLDNRQQVFLTFFTMIQRSGQKGIKRRESQTPYEFARKLKTVIPETEKEIAGVTEAFVTARYSKMDLDNDRVTLTRRYWEKIRNSLNLIRK